MCYHAVSGKIKLCVLNDCLQDIVIIVIIFIVIMISRSSSASFIQTDHLQWNPKGQFANKTNFTALVLLKLIAFRSRTIRKLIQCC